LIPPQRLSRFLSYLLRHRPKEYPLAFDRYGFVAWREVVELVQERYDEATEDDICAVINAGEKKRFELRDDKVRATYGHSFPVDLGLEPVEPPGELYYGTARDLAHSILRAGLKPRERRYVHLSASLEEAEAVGKRRDPLPAIIVVDTGAARQANIVFYSSGPLFLTDNVPPQFLSLKQL
jgi:putative RNA 2'-phosphotransferase